jgi:hypothetical protein
MEHLYIHTKIYIKHQHYLGHCLDANPLGFDGAASKRLSHLSREVCDGKNKCAAVHIGTPKFGCDTLMCRNSD